MGSYKDEKTFANRYNNHLVIRVISHSLQIKTTNIS